MKPSSEGRNTSHAFYTANLNESENHLEHVMQFEEYSCKVALDLVTGRRTEDGGRTEDEEKLG